MLGFNFFTDRSQAIRLIKYCKYGCNVEKAEREKMMGGLDIDYFMEPFAIYKNNSLNLKLLKTFSRIDSDNL